MEIINPIGLGILCPIVNTLISKGLSEQRNVLLSSINTVWNILTCSLGVVIGLASTIFCDPTQNVTWFSVVKCTLPISTLFTLMFCNPIIWINNEDRVLVCEKIVQIIHITTVLLTIDQFVLFYNIIIPTILIQIHSLVTMIAYTLMR